jgi:hypothetical protein
MHQLKQRSGNLEEKTFRVVVLLKLRQETEHGYVGFVLNVEVPCYNHQSYQAEDMAGRSSYPAARL